MWKEGVIEVYGDKFRYWIKVYKRKSQYGIDGGRISKLMLKRNGKTVCNYDRGWDIRPADEFTQIAFDILVHTEN